MNSNYAHGIAAGLMAVVGFGLLIRVAGQYTRPKVRRVRSVKAGRTVAYERTGRKDKVLAIMMMGNC